ncbi:PIN domain-containing protein [Palaeococcus ferrophilus]|uniref:PIN domain-containing protein n=1 Tax=Palaeococcus ferrophilus TaxID=83868 RepID=UPI001FE12A7B|nr:PIN domain-containing protein [Palaeococcus ferrophilus]
MFLDSSVLYNYLVETELTKEAVKLVDSDEVKIVSDTVIDELFYVLLRRSAQKEYGVSSAWGLKKLLRKNESFRKISLDVISTVLSLIEAKGIIIVPDSRDWLTIGTLVHDYSLLPHDARILATALENNCTRLATFDEDSRDVDIIEIVP